MAFPHFCPSCTAFLCLLLPKVVLLLTLFLLFSPCVKYGVASSGSFHDATSSVLVPARIIDSIFKPLILCPLRLLFRPLELYLWYVPTLIASVLVATTICQLLSSLPSTRSFYVMAYSYLQLVTQRFHLFMRLSASVVRQPRLLVFLLRSLPSLLQEM